MAEATLFGMRLGQDLTDDLVLQSDVPKVFLGQHAERALEDGAGPGTYDRPETHRLRSSVGFRWYEKSSLDRASAYGPPCVSGLASSSGVYLCGSSYNSAVDVDSCSSDRSGGGCSTDVGETR